MGLKLVKMKKKLKIEQFRLLENNLKLNQFLLKIFIRLLIQKEFNLLLSLVSKDQKRN